MDPRVIESNRRRLGGTLLQFIHQDELARAEYTRYFDVIVCMEVCEHLVNPDAALDLFQRLLAPTGRIVVSVPVETGPALVVKQVTRRIAGWRRIGDYRFNARYTWSELVRSILAGRFQHIPRPVHHHDDGSAFHDHKGFNWRVLRDKIAKRFEIERIAASPVGWLGPGCNSQAWFVGHARG